MIPSVAGCTTGSLYPRCPYTRDEVLSLYLAEFLSTLTTLPVLARKCRTLEHNVPHRTEHGCSKGYDKEGG